MKYSHRSFALILLVVLCFLPRDVVGTVQVQLSPAEIHSMKEQRFLLVNMLPQTHMRSIVGKNHTGEISGPFICIPKDFLALIVSLPLTLTEILLHQGDWDGDGVDMLRFFDYDGVDGESSSSVIFSSAVQVFYAGSMYQGRISAHLQQVPKEEYRTQPTGITFTATSSGEGTRQQFHLGPGALRIAYTRRNDGSHPRQFLVDLEFSFASIEAVSAVGTGKRRGSGSVGVVASLQSFSRVPVNNSQVSLWRHPEPPSAVSHGAMSSIMKPFPVWTSANEAHHQVWWVNAKFSRSSSCADEQLAIQATFMGPTYANSRESVVILCLVHRHSINASSVWTLARSHAIAAIGNGTLVLDRLVVHSTYCTSTHPMAHMKYDDGFVAYGYQDLLVWGRVMAAGWGRVSSSAWGRAIQRRPTNPCSDALGRELPRTCAFSGSDGAWGPAIKLGPFIEDSAAGQTRQQSGGGAAAAQPPAAQHHYSGRLYVGLTPEFADLLGIPRLGFVDLLGTATLAVIDGQITQFEAEFEPNSFFDVFFEIEVGSFTASYLHIRHNLTLVQRDNGDGGDSQSSSSWTGASESVLVSADDQRSTTCCCTLTDERPCTPGVPASFCTLVALGSCDAGAGHSVPECPSDLTNEGNTGVAALARLLVAWGPCMGRHESGHRCSAHYECTSGHCQCSYGSMCMCT